MRKIIDSLNKHVKHVKAGVSIPSNGEFMPLFAELYFEAVNLKHDPKRNPARALFLIKELEKNVEFVIGGIDATEQQKELQELLNKAKEETLSGQKDCYRSIVLALVQYKHYL